MTSFFRRDQTSIQNLSPKWIFCMVIFRSFESLVMSNAASIRFFNYWTKICLMGHSKYGFYCHNCCSVLFNSDKLLIFKFGNFKFDLRDNNIKWLKKLECLQISNFINMIWNSFYKIILGVKFCTKVPPFLKKWKIRKYFFVFINIIL